MQTLCSMVKNRYFLGLVGVLALPVWALTNDGGRSPRGPSVGWDALTESGGTYEDERELGQITPWEPDDDVDAMGGLRGDGDIVVYDNAPCGGNGIVDLDDIFGVLDAFGGTFACSCPAAGGWTLTGNGGTNPATNFLGTTDNVALNVRVNNLRAFRLEPNATAPNVIGGFSGNTVTAGAIGATIAGGGRTNAVFSSANNSVTDSFGTASKLHVSASSLPTLGEVIQFESTFDLANANDLLALNTPSTSNVDMQFIECSRGSDIEFRVWGDGDVTADGTYTSPADFAEMIKVTSGVEAVEPGDVMIIDVSNPRSVVKSSQARSTLVAGIHSTKPGFLGSEHDWDDVAREILRERGENQFRRVNPHANGGAEDDDRNPLSARPQELGRMIGEMPLAIVGIVPCKVSAENGAIRPGDLLVTSATPGYAMRDENPKTGTVVGKALGSLENGTGTITVLVTLQ